MIIKSILDTDLYKLTMMWAVIQKFPNLQVEYTFKDRDNLIYPPNFDKVLQKEINNMSSLSLTNEEEHYLRQIRFLPQAFISFLKGYKFNPNTVEVHPDSEGHLNITITGYWYDVILWEVPLLAMISELYYIETNQTPIIDDMYDLEKLYEMEKHGAHFSDFGTRRRFSYKNQERIIQLFTRNPIFVGTSNVHFAHKFNIKAIGTMAHEWIMVHSAIYGYNRCNHIALDNWADVYNGDLGIALPDTYTNEVFLKTFDKKLAKLYDGARQDSGNPYRFTDVWVDFYRNFKIDPMSKVLVFSNALNIESACKIKEYCVGKIKSSFGIGTHLTNDVYVRPMNIVIKVSKVLVNDVWVDVVKLSDDEGKYTGNPTEVQMALKILKIKN